MRGKGAIAACVGLALLAGGCKPGDWLYVNEGAGVDLYSPGTASEAELLDAYTVHVCRQIGPICDPGSMTFVLAGMNDIDRRCDGFLTWLDARRRDREPVLAQLSAINTAVHTIMTVTGSSPQSLNIATAAFGLASATYANWNSRLLISVEQSTVQEVVYNSQGQYRAKIRDFVVADRPTAIYLLRNYLRLCMPIAIEANINTSAMIVQRGPVAAAAVAREGGLVVANVTPSRPSVIRDINVPLRRFDPGIVTPPPSPLTRLSQYEQTIILPGDMRFVLDTLCRPKSERDLGPAGSAARKALANFLTSIGSRPVEVLDRNAFIDIQESRRRAC